MTVALPLIFALTAWFVSTGAIVWLDARPRRTFALSLAIGGAVALAALGGIWASRDDTSTLGAYCAFSAALLVWGWHEMSFLMGAVTGPRRSALPAGSRGWVRFKLSAATVIHHEVALAVTLAAIAALTWHAPNQTAFYTFALLFAMRLSTKFNIFAGVPNLSADLLPPHLDYLKSYFRKGPLTRWFAVSLLLAVGATATIGVAASQSAQPTGLILLFTLAMLGIIEHAFLALPLPDAALWRWASAAKPVMSPARRPTKVGTIHGL